MEILVITLKMESNWRATGAKKLSSLPQYYRFMAMRDDIEELLEMLLPPKSKTDERQQQILCPHDFVVIVMYIRGLFGWMANSRLCSTKLP